MMTKRPMPGPPEAQDDVLEGACPTCDGSLTTRITHGQIWAYCATCVRLSRPVVLRGPGNSAVLMHVAAAA